MQILLRTLRGELLLLLLLYRRQHYSLLPSVVIIYD